jgi:hypothetical protein
MTCDPRGLRPEGDRARIPAGRPARPRARARRRREGPELAARRAADRRRGLPRPERGGAGLPVPRAARSSHRLELRGLRPLRPRGRALGPPGGARARDAPREQVVPPSEADVALLCDTLLALGEPNAAMPLIGRMDSGRGRFRPEVLVRRAWAELLLGDMKNLRRTLPPCARLRDPRTGRARRAARVLEVALLGRPHGGRRRAARELVRPSPLQDAALLALEGKRRRSTRRSRPRSRRSPTRSPVDRRRAPPPRRRAGRTSIPRRSPTATASPRRRRASSRRTRRRTRGACGAVILALGEPAARGWVQAQVVASGGPRRSASRAVVDLDPRALAQSQKHPAAERRILEDLLVRWPGFGRPGTGSRRSRKRRTRRSTGSTTCASGASTGSPRAPAAARSSSWRSRASSGGGSTSTARSSPRARRSRRSRPRARSAGSSAGSTRRAASGSRRSRSSSARAASRSRGAIRRSRAT